MGFANMCMTVIHVDNDIASGLLHSLLWLGYMHFEKMTIKFPNNIQTNPF